MSGALAPSRQAAKAKRERRFSPISASSAPASVWVMLSNYRTSDLLRPRLLFDHPGLALGDERLEVGGLATRGGAVLLDDGALEGRTRVLVNDAERDREAFVLAHLDEHRRNPAVGRIVDD